MVTGRPARALLATLAVGALAVVGIDDPSHVPEPVRDRIQATATPAGSPLSVERPNVLMVTVDDLAADDMSYLPHVRELMGTEGVTFTDGLAPSPMCVPARASLLTGKYAHNHGAYTVRGPRGGYPAFEPQQSQTIAKALHDDGYETYFAGKYLNGYGKDGTAKEVPPGWTEWRATVDPSTYRFFNQRMNINGQLKQTKGYTTNVMTRQAERMIDRGRGSGKSWFAWINYVAPHVGGPASKDDPKKLYAGTPTARLKTTVPAVRDRNTFRKLKLPIVPNSFPSHDDRLPKAAPANRNVTKFDARDKKALNIVYERRIEAAQGLDRAVATLIDKLRQTGQLDRTLVVFTSDNGYAIGNHNLNGKLYQYDEPLRIPILMRGPGLPKGATVDTAVTNPDLAATILAATGVRPTWDMDGVDILPWVEAPAQVRVVPIEAWPVSGTQRIYFGVRVGAWTFARYRKGGEELYDRSTDPYEMHNLAADPDYRPVRKALLSMARRYRGCEGDTCPKDFYPAAELSELVADG